MEIRSFFAKKQIKVRVGNTLKLLANDAKNLSNKEWVDLHPFKDLNGVDCLAYSDNFGNRILDTAANYRRYMRDCIYDTKKDFRQLSDVATIYVPEFRLIAELKKYAFSNLTIPKEEQDALFAELDSYLSTATPNDIMYLIAYFVTRDCANPTVTINDEHVDLSNPSAVRSALITTDNETLVIDKFINAVVYDEKTEITNYPDNFLEVLPDSDKTLALKEEDTRNLTKNPLPEVDELSQESIK